MKKLFTLMGLFALSFSFAQNIYLLEDYLKLQTPGASVSLGNAPTENPANARLKSLLFDLLPNVTVTPEKEHHHFATGTTVPLVIRIDWANLDKFSGIKADQSTVEAVVINMTNHGKLTTQLPASLLRKLPQLKYVFFDSGTEISTDEIAQLLQGEYPGITFLYRVSTPG